MGRHPYPRQRGRGGSHPLRWLGAVVLALAVSGMIAVLVTLLQRTNPPPASQPLSTTTPSDWKRVLDALAPLPPFLQTAPTPIQEAYAFAAARPDVLMWLPCYCGCVYQGHSSNLDCFIDGFSANGKPIWDPHAST